MFRGLFPSSHIQPTEPLIAIINRNSMVVLVLIKSTIQAILTTNKDIAARDQVLPITAHIARSMGIVIQGVSNYMVIPLVLKASKTKMLDDDSKIEDKYK